MAENKDNRTATQRIEDLEKMAVLLYQSNSELVAAVQNFQRIAGDMGLIKDALKLLNRKAEAIVQAATSTAGITAKNVSDLVINMNVEDLKAQVQGYLASGQIEPAESVTQTSFVVCEESNSDGLVVNPRIQFRTDTVEEKIQKAIQGAKVGDTVSFGEGNFSAKVLEVYNLVPPKAPELAADPEAAPAAPEAPAPTPQEATSPPADITAPTGTDSTATPDPTPAAPTPAETAPEAAPTPAPAAPAAPADFSSPPAETPVTVFVPSTDTTPTAQ